VPDTYQGLQEWVDKHLAGRLQLHPRAQHGLKRARFQEVGDSQNACALGDAGSFSPSSIAIAATDIYVAVGNLDLVTFDGGVTVVVPYNGLDIEQVTVGRAGELFLHVVDMPGHSEILQVVGSNLTLFVGDLVSTTCVDTDQTDGGATFVGVEGLTGDDAGDLFVADANLVGCSRIRKIDPSGYTTTLAGDGLTSFRDGPAGEAEFNDPQGLCVDSAGNVYVADLGNDVIRKIAPDGTTSTLAGNTNVGFNDGTGGVNGTATFSAPSGVAVDSEGVLYVADQNNNSIRMVLPDGTTTTLAGNGDAGFSWRTCSRAGF